MTHIRLSHIGIGALAIAAVAACDDNTAPEPGPRVTVAFGILESPSNIEPTANTWGTRALSLDGTNGTLVLDELRLIVADFELERLNDDACETGDDACEKFEAPPAFVDVPLDGGQDVAVAANVEPGTYDELGFEVEDLEDDEEDPVEAQQIAELMADVLAEFPDWPREASMLVVGTFTPTGGEAIAFRAYFEAEVEIEMDILPPVTVFDDDGVARFTVRIDPAAWFTRGDGTVLNLAELDYDATGAVVEFEVEIEDGFTRIEFDDD